MKYTQKVGLIASLTVGLTACGLGIGGRSSSKRGRVPEHTSVAPADPVAPAAPAAPSEVLSESDLLKMPRAFLAEESAMIPRLVLDSVFTEDSSQTTYKPEIVLSNIVENRAFICANSNETIATLLKRGMFSATNFNAKETFGSLLAKMFPAAEGTFPSSFNADGQQPYVLSQDLGLRDAAIIRKFICFNEEPATFVKGSVAAFEALASSATVDEFHRLSGVQNAGVSCFVEPVNATTVKVSLDWSPTDEFVKSKLPTMNVSWAVNGQSAASALTTIAVGKLGTSEFARNEFEESTYTATLTDASGRVSLNCSRVLAPVDKSAVVQNISSDLCGTHVESVNNEFDYFVDVDAGFQFPATAKTYETTCGGSVEAYHTACAAGEVMVEGSHANTAVECVYMNEVCVGGGRFVPRVCQAIPEMRHRNIGSVTCQNPTRATRSERRVRVETSNVTVANTCEIPVKI